MSGSRAAFAADDVVGGYHLVRPAGKGGMAEVWLARKGGRGRPVALKVVLPHLAGEARYARMFRTEAEVSGLMSHSNIVQCFDEGEDQGVSYLVMEWVEGINLVRLREALKLIDNAEVRHSMVAFVIGQLLHGLGYAHQLTDPSGNPLGIVHRDISPQNVLVSTAGDVKLLDFGVAHTVIEESSGMHVKGKLRYMAPEQLTSRTKAPTLDLFGVGALLHELLDGKRFRGDFKDDRQLHAQVMRGVVPMLRSAAPPELEQLRQALLSADPSGRPQSAEAALEILRSFRGYRDCRVELSKVVGSLMGSTRPRSAVEPSSASTSRPAPSAPSPGPAPAPPSVAPPSVAPPPASLSAPSVPQPVAPAAVTPAAVAPAAPAAAAAPPERTMFLDGGGLPPGALAPEPTAFLPNPNAPQSAEGAPIASPQPIQEPTAFLPNPNAPGGPGGVDPMADAEEGTAFVAPPSAHGPAHAPPAAARPPSQVRAPSPSHPPVAAPQHRGHAATPDLGANEPSMTRFVVQERNMTKTILMFVAGLVLALSAAGAAAYFILEPSEPAEASE
ncbi:MAG: serine/threonine protein kinase [Nannocystaceae bacterium]|nr:serine/threonine protein kinase [bacterium]